VMSLNSSNKFILRVFFCVN